MMFKTARYDVIILIYDVKVCVTQWFITLRIEGPSSVTGVRERPFKGVPHGQTKTENRRRAEGAKPIRAWLL
jgi:hypothetical protein